MSDEAVYAAPDLGDLWSTPPREELLRTARSFSREVVLPAADEFDRQEVDIPPHVVSGLAERGLFGVLIPGESGGLGHGIFEYCMVSEELARSWMSVASIIARGQGLGTLVADPDERSRLLAEAAAGRWIGAVALSEPGVGSDLASVETTAVRDGDHWVISGRKKWCGNALAADFIQVLVRAKSDAEDGGQLRSLLVRKGRGTFPSGVTGNPIDKVGYHGIVSWDLTFTEVRVPVTDTLLGFSFVPGANSDRTSLNGDTDRETFRQVQRGLNIARVQTAARAVGLARAAVEDTTVYLQHRRQFGRPIGDFQALRFELATMAAEVDQARAFYRQVAHQLDQGDRAERESAMTKLLATEMAVRVTNQAMQLHGGNGYSREHRVERYWRDARLTTIFEGTSEIQRRIISDRILPRSPLS